jgi:hypothetical protein
MEVVLSDISYRYRAPVRYLVFFAGFIFAGGVASFFFATVTPWIFRAILLFIMAVGFGGGLAFLGVYLQSLAYRIVFFNDAVVLPFRRKRHNVVLDYSEFSVVEQTQTYGRQLLITASDDCCYILDETWMEDGQFDEISSILMDKTKWSR